MLEMFRNSITDEEMYGLCRVLYERAITGDMSALKMIWQYKLGKPLPAPHPDTIDRDEWDHFQKDAMTLDEMKQVLGQLPSRIGNSIVSAALPSITSAISHTLAQQLLQGLPAEYLGNQSTGPANNEPNPTAGSNGFLPAEPVSESPPPATLHTPPATHPSSGSNGYLPAEPAGESPSPATLHTPPATHPSSGSNGFLPVLEADGLPARPVHHPRASSKPSRAVTAQSNKQAHDPASLSTCPTSPATRSIPVSNGKSKSAARKKKARKMAQKQWLEPIAKKCQASKERMRKRVVA
jgi:hypothetical protein